MSVGLLQEDLQPTTGKEDAHDHGQEGQHGPGGGRGRVQRCEPGGVVLAEGAIELQRQAGWLVAVCGLACEPAQPRVGGRIGQEACQASDD